MQWRSQETVRGSKSWGQKSPSGVQGRSLGGVWGLEAYYEKKHQPPTPRQKISSDLRELQKWPLAFRGEQLLHTSYATLYMYIYPSRN